MSSRRPRAPSRSPGVDVDRRHRGEREGRRDCRRRSVGDAVVVAALPDRAGTAASPSTTPSSRRPWPCSARRATGASPCRPSSSGPGCRRPRSTGGGPPARPWWPPPWGRWSWSRSTTTPGSLEGDLRCLRARPGRRPWPHDGPFFDVLHRELADDPEVTAARPGADHRTGRRTRWPRSCAGPTSAARSARAPGRTDVSCSAWCWGRCTTDRSSCAGRSTRPSSGRWSTRPLAGLHGVLAGAMRCSRPRRAPPRRIGADRRSIVSWTADDSGTRTGPGQQLAYRLSSPGAIGRDADSRPVDGRRPVPGDGVGEGDRRRRSRAGRHSGARSITAGGQHATSVVEEHVDRQVGVHHLRPAPRSRAAAAPGRGARGAAATSRRANRGSGSSPQATRSAAALRGRCGPGGTRATRGRPRPGRVRGRPRPRRARPRRRVGRRRPARWWHPNRRPPSDRRAPGPERSDRRCSPGPTRSATWPSQATIRGSTPALSTRSSARQVWFWPPSSGSREPRSTPKASRTWKAGARRRTLTIVGPSSSGEASLGGGVDVGRERALAGGGDVGGQVLGVGGPHDGGVQVGVADA